MKKLLLLMALVISFASSSYAATELVTETLEPGQMSFNGTSGYQDFTISTDNGAEYAGNANKTTTKFQFNKTTTGIWVTKSIGKVRSISVTFTSDTNNGRGVDVYGSTSVYAQAPSSTLIGTFNKTNTDPVVLDLANDNNDNNDNYVAFGIKGKGSAVYLSKIVVVWEKENDDDRTPVDLAFDKRTYNVNLNETVNLSLSGIPTGFKVTYQSENPKIATVDENGVVTGVSAGEAKIIATTEGTAEYQPGHAECKVTVIDPDNREVTFDFVAQPDDTSLYGYKVKPDSYEKKMSMSESEIKVNYNATSGSGARFWDDGLRVYHGNGSFSITSPAPYVFITGIELETETANSYLSIDGEKAINDKIRNWTGEKHEVIITYDFTSGNIHVRSIKVNYKYVPVAYTFPTPENEELVMDVKSTSQLNLGEYHPGITYAYDGDDCVDVSDAGLVTAKSAGSVCVTASWQGDDEKWLAGDAMFMVTVNKILPEITFAQSVYDFETAASGEYYVNLATTTAEGVAIEYTCSSEHVLLDAKEEKQLYVVADAPGTYEITATTAETETYKSATAALRLNIYPVADVTVETTGNDTERTDDLLVFPHEGGTLALTIPTEVDGLAVYYATEKDAPKTIKYEGPIAVTGDMHIYYCYGYETQSTIGEGETHAYIMPAEATYSADTKTLSVTEANCELWVRVLGIYDTATDTWREHNGVEVPETPALRAASISFDNVPYEKQAGNTFTVPTDGLAETEIYSFDSKVVKPTHLEGQNIETTPVTYGVNNDGTTSGIADITVNANSEVEFYNLQGVRVEGSLVPGVYIRRQGTSAAKVVIR